MVKLGPNRRRRSCSFEGMPAQPMLRAEEGISVLLLLVKSEDHEAVPMGRVCWAMTRETRE
jgi:hypothetical protein